MAAQFAWFEAKLNEESEQREAIRTVVKDLESALRSIETTLQQIQALREADCAPVLAEARAKFAPVRQSIERLAAIVPVAQFYRFCGMWKFSIQQAAFLSAFLVFLESGQLVSAAQLEELTLGESCASVGLPTSLTLNAVPLSDETRFHIELDDFLLGVCNLFSELVCAGSITSS